MKAILFWAGKTSHDVCVYGVGKELFEKLIPAFAELKFYSDQCGAAGAHEGKIHVDKETTVSFWHTAPADIIFRDVIKEAVEKALQEEFINDFSLAPKDLAEKEVL